MEARDWLWLVAIMPWCVFVETLGYGRPAICWAAGFQVGAGFAMAITSPVWRSKEEAKP